jgi:hypothetical protein
MKTFATLTALTAAGLLASASFAVPTAISLDNADFETTDPDDTPYNVGDGLDQWGPSGAQADHASFSKPNNAGLGSFFGYYTPGTEFVVQATGVTIQPLTEYTFSSFAMGGGNDTGDVGYVLAYINDTADLSDGLDVSDFTVLETQTYTVDGAWAAYAGVAGVAGTLDAASIGKELVVGLGPSGNTDDIWFDSASATFEVIPEPASIALLGAGAAFLGMRRRSVA